VIDPRALQQHFRKVQQKQEPPRASVPRVPDPKPLTAIEAIIVPEPIVEQKEVPVIEPIVLDVPKVIDEPKPEVHLVIDVPPPIGDLVINEIEEEEPIKIEETEEVLEQEETKEKAEPKTENPYGYSAPKERDEDYDPYGYYSGPRF
jgi:hypothetical protein